MLAVNRMARNTGRALFAIALLAGLAVAMLCARNPASAAAVLAAVQSAVTCASTGTTPCFSATNSSSGIGVLGSSNSGTGVRGSANTNYGIKGSSGTSYGIFGTSTSGQAGVAGTTAGNDGVDGYTTNSSISSKGVYGNSPEGYGLYGDSPGSTGYGVEGVGGAIGVVGSSTGGEAFFGTNSSSSTPTLLTSNSGAGFGAEVFGSGTTNPAAYIQNRGSGDGLDVVSQQSSCSNGLTCAAVSARSEQGYAFLGSTGNDGVPLSLNNSDTGDLVFWVSNKGDVNYSGTLGSFARLTGGATIRSFSAKTTVPIVEDYGTAQLVAGAAAVRLDPTFVSAIDSRTAYRVYLTADGDTRGLFVETKAPASFTVRESQGGHSTVSFDYRIVATAVGQVGQRMAVVDPATLPHIKLPALPKAGPPPLK